MPWYIYTAKDRRGRLVRGRENVSSPEELGRRLRRKGLFVTTIRESMVGEKPKKPSFAFHRRRKHPSIKIYDLALLARNLSTTLSAGVTLMRSLEVIASQTESYGLEQILKKVITDVKGGLSLSESIRRYPKVFSPLWIGLVEAGEASGNLPFVLNQLAGYLEMRLAFERRVKSALVYPCIVFSAAILATIFFVRFILPKFINIFEQFNMPLPPLTEMLFRFSKFFNQNFLLIIAGTGGIIFFFWHFFSKEEMAKLRETIILRLPIFGDLFLTSNLERFASSMYILLESGVPMIYTLEIAGRSAGKIVEEHINVVKEDVRAGKSLSAELAKVALFPPLIIEMTRIGEETGNMPEMFKKISTHYREELETRIDRLTAAFEPLIILFLGVVIGSLIITLYLPIFKISSLGIAGR